MVQASLVGARQQEIEVRITFWDRLSGMLLLLPVPWMALVIAVGLIWDQIWLKFQFTRLAKKGGRVLDQWIRKVGRILLKDERNAPYLYSFFGIGLFTPLLFLVLLIWHLQYGVEASWGKLVLLAFGYHVLMMGPYFRFFAYISTLIHKEGHAPKGLFRSPFSLFNNFFGWFLGPFYGHIPEAYPMGHLRIHHRHDNGAEDITSTMHLDRTKPSHWLIYLRQFAGFWTGFSIVRYHLRRKNWENARRMAKGMLAYGIALALLLVLNPWFGFAYLLLPLWCVIIYLAAINYTWHTFMDPDDPDNDFINSVTILRGHYNVFNEDYHVTHHQRPQLHWTEAPADFQRNIEAYRLNRASVFADTQEFEMFMWIITRRFDLLAKHFVDLQGDLSKEEIEALLIRRMRPVEVKR